MVTNKTTKDQARNELLLGLLNDVLELPESRITETPDGRLMNDWIARVRADAPVLAPKLSEEIQEARHACYAYLWGEHYDYSEDTHVSNALYAELLGELADVANCLVALVFTGASDEDFDELRKELEVLRVALRHIRLQDGMLRAIVTRAYAKGFEVATRPHGE